MVKLILSLIFCITLTACVPRVVTKEKIVEKDIPIFIVPKPPDTQRPVLDIDKLTLNDRKNINKEAQAYVVSVDQLKKYAEGLETIVNKYRQLSNTSTLITDFDPKTPMLLDVDKLKEFMNNKLDIKNVKQN